MIIAQANTKLNSKLMNGSKQIVVKINKGVIISEYRIAACLKAALLGLSLFMAFYFANSELL
jgi:hypothetical protein